jgi:NADH-quinone oxidoreductase subunit E
MIGQIEGLREHYPSTQALTLPALHIVHERLRHVPFQAVVEIAELLNLAPAQVQDTLSFYGFFHQERPHGEHRAWICRSISCALRDGEALLQHVCRRLGLEPGGTTADGKLTVEYAECLGACDFAPCMLVGETLHKDLTPAKAEQILRDLGCELRKPEPQSVSRPSSGGH